MPDPLTSHPDIKYGVAGRYDFDNPQKWTTVPGVPLLDEHVMTNDQGKTVATVDRRVLEEIANNNNKRVRETGDPATLILGHTSDDPRAPEKPAQGFVVNYRVLPFKRNEEGKVIYAIHGDYKLRPKNADLVEKYPRRSVELWWHKKELDPIAMLGGSAPERDLSVVIKNARINHIDMGVNKVGVGNTRDVVNLLAVNPQHPIKFHRKGNFTIESYAIDDSLSLKKRLAKSRTAVKRYEASMNGDDDMPCDPRTGSMPYADDQFGDDEGLDTQDIHDPGDSNVPDDSGAFGDDDLNGLGDEGDIGGAGEQDPTLAKVFQSKQFRGMSAKLDMMMQMMEELTASLGGGGAAPPPGMPGEEPGAPEMPPPGAAAPPGSEPMPGEGEGEPDGDEPPPEPEEESRRSMGGRPVQMDQTGFPGSGNVAIPGFATNGKARPKQMSRNSPNRGTSVAPARPAQRGRTPVAASNVDQEVIRLRRQTHDLAIKYAQSEADRRVAALLQEGILFGRNEKEHQDGVAEVKTYFTGLLASGEDGAKDVEYEEGIIRARYQRRAVNPAAPTQPGLARYARDPIPREGTPGEGDDPNDFTPEDPEQASQFADLQAVHRMSRADAVKYMRTKYPRR